MSHELLLLWQSLMTQPGPRGPCILQDSKVTPRSYLQGNATLQMYKESASAPPPCAPCLHVSEAREAALCIQSVCGEVLCIPVSWDYTGAGD